MFFIYANKNLFRSEMRSSLSELSVCLKEKKIQTRKGIFIFLTLIFMSHVLMLSDLVWKDLRWKVGYLGFIRNNNFGNNFSKWLLDFISSRLCPGSTLQVKTNGDQFKPFSENISLPFLSQSRKDIIRLL